MQGKRLGGYLLSRRLGAGGMGTVFEAVSEGDPAAGPVAVKVLHPHLLGRPGFFKRFLREAEIGKRVRHENVVRTLDADAAMSDGDQYHFLVMEFVAGRTLRDLLEELRVIPEALVREVARQTAAGLAAIHDSGAIHRDLKPENVLITDDERVRIMDLGVARELNGSTELTLEGQFAGSVRYAAPEQFGGNPITAAADLYALGLLIYELAVGEHPFPADDTSRLIAAHLSETPPRAVERSSDVSEFLSDLVHVLLAKEAGDRIPSAPEVESILHAGESSAWWADREGARLRGTSRKPRVPVRRETAVMGRDDEVGVLRSAWERAKAGEGGVVLVEGETGIGKSRLLDSLLAGVESADAHVLYGSYAPSGGMGGLSDAIVAHFGVAGLETSLRPYLPQTLSLVPAFASMIRHESPPEGAEAPSLTALHSLHTQLLQSLAEERPVLWIIEDLHFADSVSLNLVISMARSVTDHRVLILLTARPGLPQEEMSHLGRLSCFHRVLLTRLSESDVVSLLRAALRSETLAQRLAPSIHRKSDGVPFFVFELIRGLKEGEYLSESEDGSFVEARAIGEIDVPSAVRDLVGARLAELSHEDRSLLEAAAVQGFVFDADVLSSVADRRLVRVLQDLARIERGTGVIQAAGREYRFDHHQIQEVVYGEIHPRLREEYHTLVADAFLACAGEDGEVSGENAVRIANHHLRGSRPADGMTHVLTALEHLSRTHRQEAIAKLAERALAAGGGDEFQILLRRAGSLHILGRREEEYEALKRAQGMAPPQEEARVLRAFAKTHLRVSRIDEAKGCAEAALELDRAAGDFIGQADSLGLLGTVLSHRGQHEEALAINEERLAISRERGDVWREAAAADSIGEALGGLGRSEESRRYLELAIEFARKAGHRGLEASATGNLAGTLRRLGDYETARALGEEYLELSREIGHREGIAIGTGNQARVLVAVGDLGEAEEDFRRAAVLCRELGNRMNEGMYLGMLGSLRVDMGDFEGARESLEVAREIFEEIGDRRLAGYAIRELGEVAATAGDFGFARRLYDQAEAEFAAQPFPHGQAGLCLGRAYLAAEEGDPSAAEQLDRAAAEHRDLGDHAAFTEATARLATLRPEAIPDARSLFAAHETDLSVIARMRVRWLLYRAAGDAADLRVARDLLRGLADRIPGPAGEWILTRVPMHRDIMAADGD